MKCLIIIIFVMGLVRISYPMKAVSVEPLPIFFSTYNFNNNAMEEIWKDIENYEGLYQISNLGRVKSMSRYMNNSFGGKSLLKERFMKLNPNSDGYENVRIHKNCNGETFKIHKLVASHFIDNPLGRNEVNHKNGIKNDNRVSNLEWCTHSENIRHAYSKLNRNGSMKGIMGKHNKKSKLIYQLDMDGNVINKFYGTKEAQRETGIWGSKISAVCRGDKYYKTAGGYKWKFA